MEPTAVTSMGQVTIPKEIRQRLGIRKGSKVAFSLEDGRVEMRLMPLPAVAAISGFGMLKSPRPLVPADFDPASLLADQESTSGTRVSPVAPGICFCPDVQCEA